MEKILKLKNIRARINKEEIKSIIKWKSNLFFQTAYHIQIVFTNGERANLDYKKYNIFMEDWEVLETFF